MPKIIDGYAKMRIIVQDRHLVDACPFQGGDHVSSSACERLQFWCVGDEVGTHDFQDEKQMTYLYLYGQYEKRVTVLDRARVIVAPFKVTTTIGMFVSRGASVGFGLSTA